MNPLLKELQVCMICSLTVSPVSTAGCADLRQAIHRLQPGWAAARSILHPHLGALGEPSAPGQGLTATIQFCAGPAA
ncbi:MAG: hypothetical protein ONB51_07085 [candidate division KSB1 bacterium]|nr:hypothetical protein [candidate division KSB1 bacterium]MDZ7408989.1 hypothetical protein [candidate division KSB1 bacterium]